MSQFDEMRKAVAEARYTMNAADSVANGMADILCGRLRKGVSGYILTKLKKELRDWDMHRNCWKEDKS